MLKLLDLEEAVWGEAAETVGCFQGRGVGEGECLFCFLVLVLVGG